MQIMITTKPTTAEMPIMMMRLMADLEWSSSTGLCLTTKRILVPNIVRMPHTNTKTGITEKRRTFYLIEKRKRKRLRTSTKSTTKTTSKRRKKKVLQRAL